MHVDRASFLVLTASIAAACSADRPRDPTTPVAAASITPTASATTTRMQPTPSAAPSDEGTKPPPSYAMPIFAKPRSAAQTTLPNEPSGSWCAWSTKAFDPARQCTDDTKGSAPGCSLGVTPFPTIEGTCDAIVQRSLCTESLDGLKPPVAKLARTCLVNHMRQKKCEYCESSECRHEALMGACPDASVDAACDGVKAACRNFDGALCTSMLTGLDDHGRERAVRCLQDDCSRGYEGCVLNPSWE
jgi:hypothetical protein